MADSTTTAPSSAEGPDLEELDCLVSKASAIAALISGDRKVCEVHQNAAWAITDFLAQAREILRPALDAGRVEGVAGRGR